MTFAALLAGLWTTSTAGGSQAPAFALIVHQDNPVSSLEKQFVEDAFLKRVTQWPGDGSLKPVDLAPSSPVRQRFSQDILNRSVEEVRIYWQQRIFSGRDVPPAELDSDEEIVAYVSAHPGAVGYVSPATPLKGVKTVALH